MKTALLLTLIVLCSDAIASPIDRLHVGLQFTSDHDTQQSRIDLAAGIARWRFGVVLDAPFTEGRDEIDAIVEYNPYETWGVLVGWRACAIEIEQGRQWQQLLLLGATGNLPTLFGDRIRPSFGGELASTIVRHGDSLETDWISLESQRHVKDTISVNLFLRFDYVSVL